MAGGISIRPTDGALALAVLALAACGWAAPCRADPVPAGGADLSPVTVQAPRPRTIGGPPPADPCTAVDAAGHRTGAADCGARKLQDAARAAQAGAQGAPGLAAPDAQSHDTTVGVGNVTASSQRLGGDLRGAASLPKRQIPTPPTTPFPRGR
jgi:hypothetical protein